MLKIYNTLNKNVEEFAPISEGKVNMYVCGVTVYDNSHIGHCRTFIFFDVVVRYLQHRGYEVNFVRNITDIDDKIIARANENNEPISDLTARFIAALHKDISDLKLLQPTHEPRATEYVPQMLNIVEQLIANSNAYVTDSGDVYFDVNSFADYGKLSRRKLEDLQAGARVEVDRQKKNEADFSLWKAAKVNEPAFESPWGQGRPGWHLECSAMAMDLLGNTLDIHGGGNDLIFPHHENEIAQSECVSHCNFANYWMHIGFLQLKQEKMSKSLGNIFTIQEILQEVHPDVLRHFMLTGHYRKPLEFTHELLDSSKNAVSRWYQATKDLTCNAKPSDHPATHKFMQAMNDDFNTPLAFSVLHELATEINSIRDKNEKKAGELASILIEHAKIFGFYQQSATEFLHYSTKADKFSDKQINDMIAARNLARSNKDWQTADKIRKDLSDIGIILEDSGDTTCWRFL